MGPFSKRGLIVFAGFALYFIIPGLIYGQEVKGKVLSSAGEAAIAYVNVVVLGKGIGTVSDANGNFNLTLDNEFEHDSLQFSMIGYQSRTVPLSEFRQDSLNEIFLDPMAYDLNEASVSFQANKLKTIRLGTPVTSDILRSGFSDNTLGSELGIKVNVNCRVKLKDLNLNVSVCTYDSVTYRLNIYQYTDETEYKNILVEPIYISFAKNEAGTEISFDLSRYSIVVEGTVIIALQLYKDLGVGRLLFQTNFFTGSTQFRKTNDAKWAETTGEIGMYLNGYLLN
jgi:hypothetical protein